MAAWNEAPAAGGLGECAALVRSAEALRFSAPELAVQLARRALIVGAESADASDVGEAKALSMRAQAVVAAGLVRMSHFADAVEPAFAALALAAGDGVADLATAVRLDLAACSREVGEPLLGCALLLPVLETAGLSPLVRAVALGRLVGCVAHVGRRDDIEDTLTEADRLLATDDGLRPDARRLERARLSVRAAAYHRWYGDTEDATEAAREGLTQLNRLRGLRPETARLRAQLVLELVCALLDEGALEEAASVSEAVLAEPVRATSAAAVGQLMLAVSTRVHLPSGRVERGRGLLDQAVWVAGRHGLDGLLADALTAVSQLDEKAERPAEALESLRNARAAEQRRLRSMSQAARRLLTELSPVNWDVQAVNSLLRSVVGAAAHQPAQDWHLAAQRVTQSARQRTQADHSPPPGDTQTWPSEQLPSPRADDQPATTPREDPRSPEHQAAVHTTPPADHHPGTRPGEQPPTMSWVERAAAARSGEPSTTAPWAEQFAAGRSRAQVTPAGSDGQPAAPRSDGQAAAARSDERPARSTEQQTTARAEEQDTAAQGQQPAAGSSEHGAAPQAGERASRLGEPRAGEDSMSSGERPAAGSSEQGATAHAAQQVTRPSELEGAARSGEHARSWGERPGVRSSEQGAAAHAGERGEHELSAGKLVSAAAERVHQPTDRDEATGLLNKDGLIRRLRSVRNGERPVALALVRLDSEFGAGRFADPGTRPGAAADFELSELAGRVRNIAPEDAELARSDGTELAVLLPHTTRDQAEKFAAAIESAWLGTANGHSISTGVVQSNPDAQTVDARALINAARHALTPAITAAASRRLRSGTSTVEELANLEDTGDTLRIGRAIISSLSIPTGSGGKRRAADPPEGNPPNPNAPADPSTTSTPTSTDAATHSPAIANQASTYATSDWASNTPATTEAVSEHGQGASPEAHSSQQVDKPNTDEPAESTARRADERDISGWPSTTPDAGPGEAAGWERGSAGEHDAGRRRADTPETDGVGAGESEPRRSSERDLGSGLRLDTSDAGPGEAVGWERGSAGEHVAGGRRVDTPATGGVGAGESAPWRSSEQDPGGGWSLDTPDVGAGAAAGWEIGRPDGLAAGGGRRVRVPDAGEPDPGGSDERHIDGGWPAASPDAGVGEAAGERARDAGTGRALDAPGADAASGTAPGWVGERGTERVRTADTDAASGQEWPGADDAVGNPGLGVASTDDAGRDGGRDRGTAGPDTAGESVSNESPGVGEAPVGYGSSTYEQTKAELALLMSALAAGNVSSAAPLPAPSRPVEDQPRNGASLPRLSIPTPPEPDEVPDPKPRPDIPDPGEPEPIPPAPPDPGPPPPDEPGPLTPPSAVSSGNLSSRRHGAWSRDPGNSGIGSQDAGGQGTEDAGIGSRDTGSQPTASGGTENPGIGSHGAGGWGTEEPDIGSHTTGSRGSDHPGTGSQGTGSHGTGSQGTGSHGTGSHGTGSRGTGSHGVGSRSAENLGLGGQGTEDPGVGSRGTGSRGTGSLGIEDPGIGSQDIGSLDAGGQGTENPGIGSPGAGSWGTEAPGDGSRGAGSQGIGSQGAGSQDVESSGIENLSTRRTGGSGVSRLADAFRGSSYQPETAGSRPPAGSGTQGTAPSAGRRERSSTTIAGLLAEALAAYQETADEPEPQPQRAERARDDFDRLFDWRYQSPASGRHRSPE